jgi:hypothetical protein
MTPTPTVTATPTIAPTPMPTATFSITGTWRGPVDDTVGGQGEATFVLTAISSTIFDGIWTSTNGVPLTISGGTVSYPNFSFNYRITSPPESCSGGNGKASGTFSNNTTMQGTFSFATAPGCEVFPDQSGSFSLTQQQ